jgi:hypothetical protein
MTKWTAWLPFPNNRITQCFKEASVNVSQVVIGPHLRCAGIVIFQRRAGFPILVPSGATELVRDGCGLGFHMAPCGCIRNYTACPVIVAPVAPVVVAPQYAPPVVVTPGPCPYGYYLGPYGRCLPY